MTFCPNHRHRWLQAAAAALSQLSQFYVISRGANCVTRIFALSEKENNARARERTQKKDWKRKNRSASRLWFGVRAFAYDGQINITTRSLNCVYSFILEKNPLLVSFFSSPYSLFFSLIISLFFFITLRGKSSHWRWKL